MNIIKTTPCDILCIVHRIWVEGQKKQGGMDKILEYFRKVKKRKIILVEQPLYNKGETQVFLLSPQGETKLLQISLKHHKVFLSWLKEIIFNLKVSKALILKTNFFTTDPLCALPGILFPNKFHFRYYHCIDYANQRFNNYFLNWIYKSLIKSILKKFNLISVASLKTHQTFLAMGCPAEKLVFLPNSPIFKKINLQNKEEASIICMGGTVHPKYRYGDILQIAKALKTRFPRIKFYILGGHQHQKYFQKIQKETQNLGLEKNFFFTGFLSSEKKEAFLQRAKIGISFYTEDVRFYMQYGDPLKIREYALYGIPTITDGKTPLDQEITKIKVGLIAKNNLDAVGKIAKLLTDKKLYQCFSQNAVNWAQKNDKKKMLEKLYQRIFS